MSNQVGEEFIIEEFVEVEPVFGNGRSLKFFKVLFKVLIYLDLISLLKNLNDLYALYYSLYGMDIVVFFSVYGHLSTFIFQMIGFVLIIRLIMYSIQNKAQEFAILYLWSLPISIVGMILSSILYLIQFPTDSLFIVNQAVLSFVLMILFYIPLFIYLNKRLIKKPKNY